MFGIFLNIFGIFLDIFLVYLLKPAVRLSSVRIALASVQIQRFRFSNPVPVRIGSGYLPVPPLYEGSVPVVFIGRGGGCFSGFFYIFLFFNIF